jgi:hypothetical protein
MLFEGIVERHTAEHEEGQRKRISPKVENWSNTISTNFSIDDESKAEWGALEKVHYDHLVFRLKDSLAILRVKVELVHARNSKGAGPIEARRANIAGLFGLWKRRQDLLTSHGETLNKERVEKDKRESQLPTAQVDEAEVLLLTHVLKTCGDDYNARVEDSNEMHDEIKAIEKALEDELKTNQTSEKGKGGS